MNARDELADEIAGHPIGSGYYSTSVGMDEAREIADAILAAGYRKPRTITTVEELITLEDPAGILMDYCGHPYQWGISMDGSEGWMAPHDQTPITSRHLWRFVPITVLYSPDAA